MSESENLITERRGSVLRLTLNRPEKRNAVNDALILKLTEAFETASKDPDIRAIVLTGAGDKAFCSGADLGGGVFDFDYSEPISNYANMLRAARRSTVPVIGRINGFCLAGGMGLLAVCDMAVASSSAKFGLPEVKVGLFPMQVAALLQSLIPARTFAEMCYTGEMMSAEDALACNLVNYVAAPEELDAKTDWLVERVTSKSPTAIRRGKYALSATSGMSFEQAISFLESQIGLMPMTEDAKEGITAFGEKRAPNWTGK
ncbi:enoyl-CoA hydratase/isomerase family protein [Pacificoceanicola onchidii]|uniref:enoyl-CoA hydratase/isomerase family protein n=1 Tax=Pacificoceanicola onchidii TaxID=2562685 RepID=UPI0010A5C306|nr:enoyl-CoA hydratase/isomerase family protein [Pacificoceanicola onchidii]